MNEPDNTTPLTPEQRAFLASAGTYDETLAAAQSLGAPPDAINSMLDAEPRRIAALRIYPLTLGGHLLLHALGNTYIRGGVPRPVDTAHVILALTEPEWIAHRVAFNPDGTAIYSAAEMAAKLTAAVNTFPAWAVPDLLNRFVRQLQILGGSVVADEEDLSPLDLTPAGVCPPAHRPANPTLAGSGASITPSSPSGA